MKKLTIISHTERLILIIFILNVLSGWFKVWTRDEYQFGIIIHAQKTYLTLKWNNYSGHSVESKQQQILKKN